MLFGNNMPELFKPNGREARLLSNIAESIIISEFTPEGRGLDSEDDDTRFLLRELAQDEARSWREAHKAFQDYIYIALEYQGSDSWTVEKYLTNLGESCLEHLRQGYVWSSKSQAIDINETLVYYSKIVQQDSIALSHAHNLSILKDKHSEFKDLFGKVAYMRMQGSIQNDRIYCKV